MKTTMKKVLLIYLVISSVVLHVVVALIIMGGLWLQHNGSKTHVVDRSVDGVVEDVIETKYDGRADVTLKVKFAKGTVYVKVPLLFSEEIKVGDRLIADIHTRKEGVQMVRIDRVSLKSEY